MQKLTDVDVSIDDNGRVEPSPSLKADAHSTSREYFRFTKPDVDLVAAHKLIAASFDKVLGKAQFKEKIETLCEKARSLLKINSSVPLVYAPFYLPKLEHDDIGTEVEKVYFPAIQKAYRSEFPDFDFTVEYKDSLKGKIKSISGLGHDQLEATCRKSDVLGIVLFVLREYSVQAAREQMATMPSEFSLTGILDLSASLISRPGLMFNEVKYAPMVWASGCQTTWEHANFHYEGYGYNLMFNRRVHHDLVAEYWTHGVSLFDPV